MSARNGGVVAVGFVGVILVIVGVLVVGVGVTWLYSIHEYSVTLAETFDGTPQPPPMTPLMAWTAAAGAALAVLGILIIGGRGQIVERWLIPPGTGADSEAPAECEGSITAVGVAGLCFAVIGLSEVTDAAVVGVLSGWDDEWTYVLWSGVPFLVVGMALVLRPQILSYWWKS